VAKVVAQARTAAASGEQAEAQRLLRRLQAAAPGNAATVRLAALLAPPPAVILAEPAPVTRAPAVPQPMPTTVALTPPTDASMPADVTSTRSAVADSPPTIVPDPLAPVYSNAGKLSPAAAAAARRRNGTMIPGAPVRGLPTAGYVRDSYPEPPVAKPAVPGG
jgi:hypothetical protein